MWTDFELGCPEDDYFGSAPALNTFYAYNADTVDGDENGGCNNNGATFGSIPPVQAITFLNRPMSSCIYYEADSPDGQAGLQAPQTGYEYYNYLRGRFRDGSRMVAEGNGYSPESNLIKTQFAFSGQPDQAEEWSLYQLAANTANKRYSIGNTIIGNILPDGITTVDVVHSFHQAEDNNHLENVNLMAATVPEIQTLYNNGFTSLCGLTNSQDINQIAKLSLFPNPANEQITINFPEENQQADIIIFNASGQQVLQLNKQSVTNTSIDVSQLPAGVYFIHALWGNEIAVGRFVKQ